MESCCRNPGEFEFTIDRLIQLAPCPPPWRVELLHDAGRRHNVSHEILDDIHRRCLRQHQRHVRPVLAQSICVEGCRTGATAALGVVVLMIIVGILIWRIRSRRRSRGRLLRVKKINPVLDLKNKIELSIITMDDDSIMSSDSGASSEGYYTTIVDKR